MKQKKIKREESVKNRHILCDGCQVDIGFTSLSGRKFYDDGVYNIGFKYFCSQNCPNLTNN
jgi:hypothetical protein